MNGTVYEIKNTKNEKVYIGSTTRSWKERRKEHVTDLQNGNHHNIVLQRAWNKHGQEAFEFNELFKTEHPRKQEQKLLNERKPFAKNGGYNIAKQAGGGDLISEHPNREEIEKRRDEAIRKRYENMTEEEMKRPGFEGSENPNWKGGVFDEKTTCECGNEKGYSAEKCRECYDKLGKNNPFYGKSHNEDTKEKLRKANMGEYHGDQNKLVTNGEETFNSLGKAAKAEGVTPGAIHNRLNSNNFPEWKYVKAPV